MKNYLNLLITIALFTGIIMFVYTAVQKNFRSAANDPQIQIAEDLASLIEKGSQSRIDLSQKVDISKSLAPFVIIYDANGKELASNAELNGTSPKVPSGVLNYAKLNGENRVTWQPADGVRIASVIKSFNGNQSGFVVVGRSLREVEKRIDQLGFFALITWLAGMTLILIKHFISQKIIRPVV